MKESIDVQSLIESFRASGGQCRFVAGMAYTHEQRIRDNAVQKPGLALAGFTEHVQPGRVQVFGETEMAFLQSLPDQERAGNLAAYFALGPSVVLISKGLHADEAMLAAAESASVILLESPLGSGELIDGLNRSLGSLFARTETLHAGMVDVFGVGVLITGKSGVGKSEIVLDLILRGHRLVADDRVDVRQESEDWMVASAPDITRYFMEVRGLGIINVRDMYGISAVRSQKRLEMVVELRRREEFEDIDRLGLETKTYPILGVDLPLVQVPISSGRNIASIIEVAVRNFLLKLQGIDSARELTDRLSTRIRSRTVEA